VKSNYLNYILTLRKIFCC